MSITFYASRFNEEKGWQEPVKELAHLDLNMANVNAVALIEAMGQEFDHCGTLAAAEIGAACAPLAYGEADEAIPAQESGGPGTGQCAVIDMGRSEGYIRDRARRLLRLATEAERHGFSVSWS